MSSNGNNTILWLLGGAVAGWYLFLRDDDDDDKRVRLPVTGVLRAWAEEAGRFDLVSEIADIEHEWANRDPDENEDEVAGLLNARLKAVEQVLDDEDTEAEELLRDRREDYRLRGAGKRRSNPSPSAPKIRHRDLGTGVVLDFDYADDGSLLCFVAWTAQRGTGGGWYDLTSGPFRTDDAAAFKAFYEDWRLQRNPSYRAGSTVAETILQQLGGAGRLRAMIGAKYFIDHGGALSFKFPNRQRSRGNYVKITLTPEDYYDMEFGQLMKHAVKPVKAYRGIMWDQLIEVFEQQTGLYLRL